MTSRVHVRTSADVLRRSYLRDAVGTPGRPMFNDAAGQPSMLVRGAFDPSLEINYVDDPRLAVGETLVRASIRTIRDFEGRTLTCQAQEAGFWGMRRVENLITTKTEDNTDASWVKTGSTAPGALRLREDGSNGAHNVANVLAHVAGAMAAQVEVRRAPGTGSARNFQLELANGGNGLLIKLDLGTGAVNATTPSGTVTQAQAIVVRSNDRWRVMIAGYGFPANCTLTGRMLDAGFNAAYQGDNQSELEVTHWQAELQSGQAYIGCEEYVSKGVAAAPYHGANVDGVRYFVTDYFGVKIPRYAGDTIKYLQLVGQVGGYVSTPDSAAISITGDIDIRALICPNSWTPATVMRIVSKRAGGGAAEFDFSLDIVSGKLSFNDAGGVDRISTVPVPFTAGTTAWVRVTRTVSSGALRFYTSYDYNPATRSGTWTQLGADVIGTAGAVPDTATAAFVGVFGDAVSTPFQGLIFRVQILNAAGALALDFNPNDAAAAGSANLVSATTGETWTVTGNGTLARLNTFTKMGRGGFFGEINAQNLLLRSDDLTDAAHTKTRTTIAADAIAGMNGTLIGDKLKEDATAAATHIVSQAYVKGAAALAYSFTAWLRAGERWAARLDLFNGANGAFARFDLLNQAVLTAGTLFGAGFATASATIEQVSPGVYECTLTVTSDATAALTSQIGLYNAADAYNGDNASGLFVLAQQLEQRNFRSTYIPTAAAAVTRAMDNPTLAAIGSWFNQAAGAIVTKAMTRDGAGGQGCTVSINDNSNNQRYLVRINTDGARHATLDVVNGGVFQASLSPAETPAAGVYTRAAMAFAPNDFSAMCDGGVAVTDNAGTLPPVTQMQITNHQGGSCLNGALARVWIFPMRMPDSRLPAVMSGI